MHPLLEKQKYRHLIALPQFGVAWFPVEEPKRDYFDHYDCLSKDVMADDLNAFRVGFVEKHYSGPLIDIGVGDGAFIRARGGETKGYDVDRKALDWLRANDLYEQVLRPTHRYTYPAMTFWDSLEHMNHPEHYLTLIEKWAFISMPIYKTVDSIHKSKHFKPNEHVWYFTYDGLRWFMREHGFNLVNAENTESQLGRQGVWTFAFKRCG